LLNKTSAPVDKNRTRFAEWAECPDRLSSRPSSDRGHGSMENRFFSMGEVLFYLKKSNISNIDERARLVQDYIDTANEGSG
jgi:hypothetical protein